MSLNLSYSSTNSFKIKQLWGVVARIHGVSVESGVAFLPDLSMTVSVPHIPSIDFLSLAL